MADHNDDDPFDRAVAREQELRRQQGEAARLDLRQVGRIVDEGLDVALVQEILELELPLSVDDVVDLLVDYGAEYEFFEALQRLEPVDRDLLQRMLDNDVAPADVATLQHAWTGLSVADAVAIVEEGGDLAALARTARPTRT